MKAEIKELLSANFKKLGFKVIHFNTHEFKNGVDLWVQKDNGRPLSVEIKIARRQKNNCYQVDPVQPKRKSDDLIAIILNSEYVLIESMQDHIKCCSTKGTRQFTLLCGKN